MSQIRSKRMVSLALQQMKNLCEEKGSSSDEFSSTDSIADKLYTPSSEDDSDDSRAAEKATQSLCAKLLSGSSPPEIFTPIPQTSTPSPHAEEAYKVPGTSFHANNVREVAAHCTPVKEVSETVGILPSTSFSPVGTEPQRSIVYNTYKNFDNSIWTKPEGKHMQFSTDFISGVKDEWRSVLQDQSPIQFYFAFVDFKMIDAIVEETNLYATQFLLSNDNIKNKARAHQWEPTDRKEMIHFLGLLGYMGIVRMGSIRDYWSTNWLFKNEVCKKVMSRNRFELLLKMWHFTNNEEHSGNDRLYKINSLLNLFLANCQEIYVPGKVFCIDETLIPFQGRLIMKQYIPQKAHKYGIKIFKLCCDNGYTWNMKIYAGREQDEKASVPTSVVVHLSGNLLGAGRTCITDNFYTSLQLANILLDNKTHLIGTLRSNRRGNPKNVTQAKLKKGEVIAEENERGICVIKWFDKRDVLMLSTCHTDQTVNVIRRKDTIKKPVAIMEYNAGKSSIDISDQMSSYSTSLRRTIKWYRKVAIEVLLGTAIVNAHIIYNKVTRSNLGITDFRKEIIDSLLTYNTTSADENLVETTGRKNTKPHLFLRREGSERAIRRYCKGCYKKKTDGLITKNKVPKVNTYCGQCDGMPNYCYSCFNIYHSR